MKVSHWETEKANIKMLSLLYIIRVRRPALILLVLIDIVNIGAVVSYAYINVLSVLFACRYVIYIGKLCCDNLKKLSQLFYLILQKRSVLMKKIISLILSFVLISSANAFAVSIDDINSVISDTEKYLYDN